MAGAMRAAESPRSRTSSQAAPSSARPRRRRRSNAPYVLALPFLLSFAAFYLMPIGYAVWASLHKRVHSGGFGFEPPRINFVGLDNYAHVLADPVFRSGAFRTLAFGFVQVPIMLGAALMLALILDSGLAVLMRLFRIVCFLYSPGISPFSQALAHTPVGPVNFLSQDTILWSIGNIVTWSWTGYNMLIIIAALQAIPSDILEAARTDGASELAIALRIKVPMVIPAIVLTGVFSIIGTLQLFTEPAVLAKLTGAVDSGYTPNLMAYTAAFVSNDIYYSAAVSVSIALLAFILSFALLRATWHRALET